MLTARRARVTKIFKRQKKLNKTTAARRQFHMFRSSAKYVVAGHSRATDNFTVVCLVAWSLNESEARVDLVLIETSLFLLCKFLLISNYRS